MKIRCWSQWFRIAGWISLLLYSHPAIAQLVPDTASDRSLGTTVVPATPQIDLITGGTRPGNGINLFHSFQEFNVQNGRAVYFANPAGVQNILSRITGTNPSNIFGTLGVFGGNANLFLINPNGIIFGPNARLDVGGSFIATTANAIQFGEQGFFNASTPQSLPLLTINPSALLFNQISRGNITNSSTAFAGLDPAGDGVFGLRVPDGQSLLLVGGDVNLVGGQLNALGGRVEIGGLAEPGIVEIAAQGGVLSLSFPPDVTRSNVTLTNGAQIAVNAANGGSITLTAQNITLADSSALYAGIRNFLGSENNQGGDITLNATGTIALDQSYIFNNVQLDSIGQSGNINIQSDSLSLTNGSRITASIYGKGNTGSISIQAEKAVFLDQNSAVFNTVEANGVGNSSSINLSAESLELRGGSELLTVVQGASGSFPAGRGNAGDINLNVRGAINITGVRQFRSGLFSSVDPGATGNGGNINIVTNSLYVSDEAWLDASTQGQGNAGNVFIQAKNGIFLDQNALIFSNVANGGVGEGGNINISAKSLELRGGAQLITSIEPASTVLPAGKGNAGNVNVNVQESVNITGSGSLPSGIYSYVSSGGSGNAGDITINSRSLSLTEGAELAAGTLGKGNAGRISIQASGAVFLDQEANVFSSVEAGGIGDAGGINLLANSLDLRGGSQLVTGVQPAFAFLPAGQGNAGNVNINVQGQVNIIGTGITTQRPSGIYSLISNGATGNSGDISINSGSLSLAAGARLITSTFGQGTAGNVNVNVQEGINIAGVGGSFRSGIFSSVENGAIGNGGNINVTTDSLSLTDQAWLSAATAGNGNAGSVSIQARGDIFLDTGAAITSSVAIGGVGDGGDVTIAANSLELREGAQLEASTFGQGNAGNITVTTRGPIQANNGTFGTAALQGSGGAITLRAKTIRLVGDSDIVTFVASGAGGGGNITLTADAIIALNDSDILAFAQDGKGGNITLNTPIFLGQNYRPAPPGTNPFTLEGNDRVDINASGAVSGVISLPDLTYLQHPLASLPQSLIDTNTILANSCIVRTGNGGTFLITGVGGLPVRPGDAPVPYFSTGAVQSIATENTQTSQRRPPKTDERLVEAQGVYRLSNGQLVLSWECPR